MSTRVHFLGLDAVDFFVSRKPSYTRSRTYSHGTNSLRESTLKRQSWGAGSGVTSPTVVGGNGAGSG